MKVLFSAVDRVERVVVPDVPTYRQRRLRCFYRFVDSGVSLAKAVGPEHFPSGQFGIPQQNPPELNIVAVHRTFATARCANEFFQFQKTLPGTVHIDAALIRLVPTELADRKSVV